MAFKRRISRLSYKRSGKRTKRIPKRPRAPTSLGSKLLGMGAAAGLMFLRNKLGINAETKYIDTPSATHSYATTATAVLYGSNLTTALVPGTSSSTRNGASVRMTEYDIKGQISNTNLNLLFSQVRICIVKWHCPGTNVSNDFLQLPTDINSPYNLDATYKYTVLFDRKYPVRTASGGNATELIPFEFNYQPANHHITFPDSDTTGGRVQALDGVITLYAYTDVATVGQFPNISYYARMKFVDN